MYSIAITYAAILICVTPHIFNVVHSHFHNVTTYCQPKEQILVGHRYNVRINVSYVDENGTYIENFTYVNETYSYHYNVGYFGPPVANISIPLNCTPCLPGHYCPGNGTIIPCSSGKYGNKPNQTNSSFACHETCTPGRYSGDENIVGKTNLEDACPQQCPAGRYGEHNRTGKINMQDACPYQCSPSTWGTIVGSINRTAACAFQCHAGRFGNIYGQSTLETACPHFCPGGKFGNVTRQANEEFACIGRCSQGRYGNASIFGKTTMADACPNLCGAGKWGTVIGSINETLACSNKCPSGRFGSIQGATTLDIGCPGHCPGGKFSSPLLLGKTTEQESCVNKCKGGTFSAPSLVGKSYERDACPYRCPAGKYGNISATTSEDAGCIDCAPGKYGLKTGIQSEVESCSEVCIAGRYGNISAQDNLYSACPNTCVNGRYGNTTGQIAFLDACYGVCPLGRYGHIFGQTTVEDACPEHFDVRVLNTNGLDVAIDENTTVKYYTHYTEPKLHVYWQRPNKTDYNISILAITRDPLETYNKYCIHTWGLVYIPPCKESGACQINDTIVMNMPRHSGSYQVSLWKVKHNKTQYYNFTRTFAIETGNEYGSILNNNLPNFNYSGLCSNYTDLYGTNWTTILAAYEQAFVANFIVQPAVNIVASSNFNHDQTKLEAFEGNQFKNNPFPLPTISMLFSAGPERYTNNGMVKVQIDGQGCFYEDDYLKSTYSRLIFNGNLLKTVEFNVTYLNWETEVNATIQTLSVIDNIHQEELFSCAINVYVAPANGQYRNGWDDLASVLTIGKKSVRIKNENRKGKVMKIPVPIIINDDDLTFLKAPIRDRMANGIMVASIVVFTWRLLSYFIWLMIDTWDLRDANNKTNVTVAGARSAVCETRDRRFHHGSIWFLLWTYQFLALTSRFRFVEDYGTTYGPFIAKSCGFTIFENVHLDFLQRPVPWPLVVENIIDVNVFPKFYNPPPLALQINKSNATEQEIVYNASCGNFSIEEVQGWYNYYNQSYWNWTTYTPVFNDTSKTQIKNCSFHMCGNYSFDEALMRWESSGRKYFNISSYYATPLILANETKPILGVNRSLIGCNTTYLPTLIDCVNDGFCYDFDLTDIFSPNQFKRSNCDAKCSEDTYWETCPQFCAWFDKSSVKNPVIYNKSFVKNSSQFYSCPCITPLISPSPSPDPVIDPYSMVAPLHNTPVLDGIERGYFPDATITKFSTSLFLTSMILLIFFIFRYGFQKYFGYRLNRWIKEYRDCPVFASRINVMVGGLVELNVMTTQEVKEMKRRLRDLKKVQSERDIAAGLAGKASKGRLATNNANGLELILERFNEDYASIEKCALGIFLCTFIAVTNDACAAIASQRDVMSGLGWFTSLVLLIFIWLLSTYMFQTIESRMIFKDTNLPDTLSEGNLVGYNTEELRLLSLAHATRFGTWIASGKDRHWKEKFGLLCSDFIYCRESQKEFRPYMFGMYEIHRLFLVAATVGATAHIDENGATQGWIVFLLQLFHVCILIFVWPYNDRITNFIALTVSILFFNIILFSFLLPTPTVIGHQSPFGVSNILTRKVVEEIMLTMALIIFITLGIRESTGIFGEMLYGSIKMANYIESLAQMHGPKCCRRKRKVYVSSSDVDAEEEKKIIAQKKEQAKRKKSSPMKKSTWLISLPFGKSKKQTLAERQKEIELKQEESSSDEEDEEDPEDEIKRIRDELLAEGFAYNGNELNEEKLVMHATAASRKATLEWVRKELRPLGKKTLLAGGVSKEQAKKDQKRLKALEEAKREETNKRVKEQEDYENLLEKRANMTVSMNLASHRGMDSRTSSGYDAV